MKRKLLCALLTLGLLLGSAQGAESSFSDVKTEDWFAPYVNVCVESGLMKGTGNNRFSPQGVITAAEVATIAARLGESLNNAPIVTGTAAPGENLPWYHWYVENLKGYGVTVSAPESPASRLEFISYLAAVTPKENLTAINAISTLPDVTDKGVLSFYNAGILTGVDNYGTFAGDRTLTRSEAAAMVARLAEPQLRLPFSPLSPEDPGSSGGASGGTSSGTSGQPSGGTTTGDVSQEAVAMMVNDLPVSLSELAGWITAVAYQTDMALASQYGSRLDLTDPDMAQAVLEEAQLQAAAQALMESQAARLGCEVNSLAAALAPSPSQEELQSYVADNGLLCAKHILVPEAQSAQAVLDGMKAKPTLDQFEALLYVFGTDPGMTSNPDGYLFGPGEMVQEFEAGTKALDIGSYSLEPVQTSFGYHIIWRLDPLTHPDLLPQYRNAVLEQYVNRWLREADIIADSQVISQLDMATTYAAYLQILSSMQQQANP